MKIANSTVLVTGFVILIILLLIVPLSPGALDFMYILNLTISFLVLIMSMNIREALEFSIFPSMLLITTLFRLTLNVSAVRLILLEKGEAGQMIKTFGDFVIRGNPVVGLVIFIIIVLVQFIVITKGSERVAEVAARFTLDAMPGKQMAIDADLNSGLIDENQARVRRSKVQREADFFGSMDGASKFVKGDAIMSIVVTMINLVGGIITGFMNNMGSFSDIMSIYTTVTVGAGLVTQIPALLISVATGMIVTRSASENNLNEEISRQFLSQPKVLMMAGGSILLLLFVKGFPRLPIILVSGGFIALGAVMLKKGVPVIGQNAEAEAGLPQETEETTSEAQFYKNIENVYGLLNVEPIEMEFGYSLIPLVDENSGGTFIDRVVMFRKQLAADMGIVVPSVRLKDSGFINPNQYSIKFKGEEVARGDVLPDHFLALAPGDQTEEIEGIDTIEPAFNIPARWISEDKRVKAELAGYTLIDPASVIITHLSETIKSHLDELLTRGEVNNILDNVKKVNENLVSETIPDIISVNTLQKVLGSLLREGIPIRDMETILETLGDYGLHIKDTDMLTEYVRQALKRAVSRKYSEAGQMKVITLDSRIEDNIMQSVKNTETGSYLALDPTSIQNIVSAVAREVDKIKDIVTVPIILTSPVVRVYVKKLLDQFYPNVAVVSFAEIDNNVQVQALGNITL
ncbi:MAG: flagellar biosynthesis protein FlhA [Oscillospiraceae bacterium]